MCVVACTVQCINTQSQLFWQTVVWLVVLYFGIWWEKHGSLKWIFASCKHYLDIFCLVKSVPPECIPAEKLSHWDAHSKQALVTAKQKWQSEVSDSLEWNDLLANHVAQFTDYWLQSKILIKCSVSHLCLFASFIFLLVTLLYLCLFYVSAHKHNLNFFSLSIKTRSSQRSEDDGLYLPLYLLRHSACARQTGKSTL